MPFRQLQQPNASIMVLLKLIFVILCTPFLSPLPHKWWFFDTHVMASVRDLCKCRASRDASYVRNVSQMFEELEAKRSVMIYRVKVTHGVALMSWCLESIQNYCPTLRTSHGCRSGHFYINNWGTCFNDWTFHILHNGWIDCRDAFHAVLSVYNTAKWAENEWIWSAVANGFSTNNLFGTCQEMVISQKKQTNRYKEN